MSLSPHPLETALKTLTGKAENSIEQTTTLEDLEQLRVNYLGKKGELSQILREMGKLTPEERPRLGAIANEVKELVQSLLESRRESLNNAQIQAKLAAETLDVTLPALSRPLGRIHPLNSTVDRMIDIFVGLGYSIATGPQVETDYYNFEALNIPADHPARDMQDTFFIEKNPDILLRTHTSSVQVRVMETQQPPIRKIFPGRVFRNEAISARAHCIFHQIEGLYVNENVSFADLKQTLLFFAREMFGEKTQIRLRPSYFPFTEPSAELDVSCTICGGTGCNVCKYTGYLEILGCGMVDPNVLESSGISSDKYTGFAFGMGLERIAMLKYQVNDLRLYFENDTRFLSQFGSAY